MKAVKIALKALGMLLGLAVLTSTVLLVWGVSEPRFLDEEFHVVQVPALPPAWEGAEIAVMGDWQVGLFLDNEGTIEEAVEVVIERRPAAVLILGDFLYDPRKDLDRKLGQIAELLRPLGRAEIPVYAVLGNHDWAVIEEGEQPIPEIARRLRDTLTQAGVTVLQNETVALRARPGADEPLWLVGMGSFLAGHYAPREALSGLPADAPRLVMMHNPDGFPQIPAQAAPFSVAGHRHGGQLRIPFTPDWTWLSIAQGGEVHADGWLAPDYGAPGNRMYVNRGIGMSLLPIRINAMPELTFFTLEREPQGVAAALEPASRENRQISLPPS